MVVDTVSESTLWKNYKQGFGIKETDPIILMDEIRNAIQLLKFRKTT